LFRRLPLGGGSLLFIKYYLLIYGILINNKEEKDYRKDSI